MHASSVKQCGEPLLGCVSDCSGVIQIPGHHYFSGPEVRQPRPSPAEEVQPATGAAETVLLGHHLIRSLHINNYLVQLRYQI